ncbi:hypothetical protein PR048_016140 [Dryococelus australis]|uniref:RNase H type-1 domain-containing protein n=1 Tax=Dryococelus australis TaxID=614101 RepID=A0ABQ9HIX1_9NEOP|nr:hypothetical protein PR048_016140 [Dryococelus australis]
MKDVTFEMDAKEEKHFQDIKFVISHPHILQLPNFEQQFMLHIVVQHSGGCSFKLTYEKEALVCVFGIQKFCSCLHYSEFNLKTEIGELTWLSSYSKQLIKLVDGSLRLTRFRFKITHVQRMENTLADAFSRMFNLPNLCARKKMMK